MRPRIAPIERGAARSNQTSTSRENAPNRPPIAPALGLPRLTREVELVPFTGRAETPPDAAESLEFLACSRHGYGEPAQRKK